MIFSGNDYVAVAYSDLYDGKIRFTGIYNDGSENSEQEYVEVEQSVIFQISRFFCIC